MEIIYCEDLVCCWRIWVRISHGERDLESCILRSLIQNVSVGLQNVRETKKNTVSVTYNVTLRRVRATTVAVESNKYYIF